MRWIVGVINSQAKGHYLGGWSHWVLLLVPEELSTHLPVAVNRAAATGEAGGREPASDFPKPEWQQWQERREGRKEVKVEREKHGGDWRKGWEGGAQGTKAGCERRESQGEARTVRGSSGGIWAGLPGRREQRDRPQSGKDSVRAGRGGTVVQMTGQGPL